MAAGETAEARAAGGWNARVGLTAMSNTVQNGKGSTPRPVNRRAWEQNYGSIRWKSKALRELHADGSRGVPKLWPVFLRMKKGGRHETVPGED